MRVTELQIGDWVLINPWDNQKPHHPCKVVAINYNSYHGKDYSDWIDCDYWDEISPSDIGPIPLTEDILKENGFKYDGDAALCSKHVLIFYGDKKHGWEVNIDRDDLEPYGKSITIHVKYVHELQHALRICGVKKDIVIKKEKEK